MKSMRKLLAMVLALMLMTGTFGTALADEPVGFGDLESLQVEAHTDPEGEVDPFVMITAEKEDGTIERIDLDQDGCSVTAGDITKEAVKEETVEEGSTGDGPDSQENGDLVHEGDRLDDGKPVLESDAPGDGNSNDDFQGRPAEEEAGEKPTWALYVYSDNSEVNVETGDVKQENDSTPAVFVYSEGEGADITVKADNVSSETTALEVVNVGGVIDVTAESVGAKDVGVRVHAEIKMPNEDELVESNQEDLQKFLDANGEGIHFYDTSLETDDDKVAYFTRTYWADEEETFYTVRYVWDSDQTDWVQTDFWTAEMQENKGTTDIDVKKDITLEGLEVTGVDASSTAESQDVTIKAEGDVTAVSIGEKGTFATAIRATSGDYYTDYSGGTVAVIVDGKASASASENVSDNGYGLKAVEASAYGDGSSVIVSVGEGAQGTVQVDVKEGGKAEVEVLDGGITAVNSAIQVQNGDIWGEYGDIIIEGGEVILNVTGDVASEKSDTIEIFNLSGTVDVTVDGKITTGEKGEAVSIHNENGETNVEIVGDVTGGMGGEDAAGGIVAHNYGGTTTISVTGTTKTETYADAVINTENHGGTIEFTAAGNIESANGDALVSSAIGETAETTLIIDGDVTAVGKNDVSAVTLEVEELGTLDAFIVGEVVSAEGGKATGDGFTQAIGVDLKNAGGNLDAEINADIVATGADGNIGVLLETEEIVEYLVDENLVEIDIDLEKSQPYGEGYTDKEFFETWMYNGELYKYAGDGKYQKVTERIYSEEGTTNLTVIGNVSADQYGASFRVTEDQTATVVVDGTLSGGSAAVLIENNESVIGGNVDLVAWKLETESEDPDAALITSLEYDEKTEQLNEVQNTDAEKAVRYIVKVMEDWMSTLSFKNILSSGTVTLGEGEDSTTYHTALQDEDVKLKVDLADGEHLDGIYYDEDNLLTGENLKQDDSGNFLVKMLRGGGMLLGLKTHVHSYTKFVKTIKAPTCTEGGIDLYQCAYCSATKEIATNALGHKLKKVADAKTPTCTEDGNIAYWYCENCKKYFSDAEGKNEITLKDTIRPATGHKLKAVEAKDPTCTEDGNIAYWYCENCKKYFSDAEGKNEITLKDTIRPATGHKLKAVEAKDPTCTEDGNIAYWYCENCKKYFSDAEGKNEITLKDTIIPATGHKLKAVEAKDPTCTEDGNIAYWYCENCKKYFSDAEGKNEITLKDTIIPATGHKLKAVEAKDPTCTEDGNIAYWYCENCKKYFSDAEGKNEITLKDTIIPATGHKLKAVEAKAPTCTEDGNIAYWYCENCKKYFSDAEGKNEITLKDTIRPATGHKLKAVEAKDPTCTEDGNIAYWYCENCKKYFSDAEGKNEITLKDTIIPATGHKLKAVEAKDPTCTEDGNIAYWYCENCKKYFSDAEGKNEITLKDTIIPATGHKLKAVEAKDPTCTEDGNIAYWYCENCKKYFSDAEGTKEITLKDTIIPAKGHKLTAVEAKEPTETEPGNIAYWYCEECGKYYSDAEGKNEINPEDTVINPRGRKVYTGEGECLLKITDTTGTAEIVFQKDGTYVLNVNGVAKDQGTFALEDGKIVLETKSEDKMPVDQTEDGWQMIYILSENQEYTFLMTESDVKTLTDSAPLSAAA